MYDKSFRYRQEKMFDDSFVVSLMPSISRTMT